MKLYTEEQVRFIVNESRYCVSWENQEFELTQEEVISQVTPIELPSDDEIGEKANLLQNEEYSSTYNEGINEGFYLGVEYMQQILNQNK